MELIPHNSKLRLSNIRKFSSEAAIQRCSYKKLFWKYAANLEESTHAEDLL